MMMRLTVRLPKSLMDKLKRIQKDNPHMSLNALINEALIQMVGAKK